MNSINVDELLAKIWEQYLQVTPTAGKIHKLLRKNQAIINDHIAFRTFNLARVNLATLSKHFIALGYVEKGQYQFKTKKLLAKHFEHKNKNLPKIFISELLVEQLSQDNQIIINQLVAQTDELIISQAAVLYSGRHWQLSYTEYQALLAESEYAAWLAAWGFRANHFTVSINHLNYISEVKEINSLIKKNGIKLNTSGGEIKGTKQVMLEQSATIADQIPVTFSDRTATIASCFYEFAKRYPMKNGELFQGFVEASADKIFESTNQVTNDNKIKPS